MSRYHLVALLAILLSPCVCLPGLADDQSSKSVPGAASKNSAAPAPGVAGTATEKLGTSTKTGVAKATAADIDRWIENLDSASFTKREEASDRLFSAGKAAMPGLIRAAKDGELETVTRAIAVLRRGMDASDEATRNAAREALEGLASNDTKSVAHRAKQALDAQEKTQEKNDNPAQMGAPFGGKIIVNGGRLIINGAGVTSKSVSVSNVNGVTETSVTEDGRKVTIVDDPGKSLKIEFKHKRGEKEVVDKYEAKNADDLKKQHPEGYKLYKEYGQQANNNGLGAIQLQIGVAPAMGNLQLAPPNVAPGIVNPLPLNPVPLNQVPANAAPINPAQPNGVQFNPVPINPVPINPVPGPTGTQPNENTLDKSLDVSRMMMQALSSEIELLDKQNALQNASSVKKAELKKELHDLKQRLDGMDQKLSP